MENKKIIFSNYMKEMPDLSLFYYSNLSYFVHFDETAIRYGGIYINRSERKDFLLLVEVFGDIGALEETINKLKRKGEYFVGYQPDFIYIKKYFSGHSRLSYKLDNKIITALSLVGDNEQDIISFINIVQSSKTFSVGVPDADMVNFLPDSVKQYGLASIYLWRKSIRDDTNFVHQIRFTHANYEDRGRKLFVRIHFFCYCCPEKLMKNYLFLDKIGTPKYNLIKHRGKDYYTITSVATEDDPTKHHIFHLDEKNKFLLELGYDGELEKSEILSVIDESRKNLDGYVLHRASNATY